MKINRIVAVTMLVAIVSGCAVPRVCTTRTELTEVPVPVWLKVPEELAKPIHVDPLPEIGTNGALVEDGENLESALGKCQDDRAELRAMNERRGRNEQR